MNLTITSIIFITCLALEAGVHTPASHCYLPKMAGQLPHEFCQLHDFLKTLGLKKFKTEAEKKEWLEQQRTQLGNVLLISGPTGTGKTTAAQAIASHTHVICHYYDANTFFKSGKSPEEAIAFTQKIYEKAILEAKKTKKMVILILDDLRFDESQLNFQDLCQLRMLRTIWKKLAQNSDIITIAISTMNPDNETAKIVKTVKMNLPDEHQRYDIISFYVNKIENYRMTEAMKQKLARQTKGFSHFNFHFMFSSVHMLTAYEEDNQVRDEHIEEAFQHIKISIQR